MSDQKSFIHRMQEHLKRNQFSSLPDDDLWGSRVEYDLEQQEVRFLYEDAPYLTNQSSPYLLGAQLAELHLASADFTITKDDSLNRIGTWTDHWHKRVKRIQKVRDQYYQAGTNSLFEELLLEDYTYFNQLAQVALFYLEDHYYDDVVNKVVPFSKIAYRSFSWQDVEQNYSGFIFTNPENWILDIGARDLGQFTLASSMDTFSFDEAIQVLHGYQRNRELIPAEYELIYAQLLYPSRWIQLVEKYASRQNYPYLNWEDEMKSLHRKYQEWEPVLADFAGRIKHEFGANIKVVDWIHRRKTIL